MPDYLAFDPHPRPPAPLPPGLACDSQFHVFGDPSQYPIQPGAVYSMPSATWEVARELHRTLGIERGVVVQATTYGADHRVVLDALEGLNAGASNKRYVGCANAAVLLEGSDAYLQQLNDAGVRGARFSRAGLGISFAPKELDRALARIAELGWYVKVQPSAEGIAEQLKDFEHLKLAVVLDHMGRANPALGLSDPSLDRVLGLLKEGNFWVMLSLSEKISRTGPPWDDVIPLAQTLIDAAPDRCIWGSDWPHPISLKQPPNEGLLMELLYRFAPDAAALERILVTNPARLFGFCS
ncbi:MULTISPECIES: amidohydrolase [unclassified Pseudomonas]|uniref:amidohydrolase family protein n=1 Tax=unclassified Pseudomonas TaxID=196821 RepID=UPI000BC62E76|nr:MULTISPECIES: amidohydrolase family protein [unclassified Pseudomonas]PVZ19708.1 putative TIM-barrel fold metal-dependent hydrolase [Pseudomonas sp. URIL14HWK12:I12]PVZ22707.1 putative TIM-barrel fold metal-dependent hydrolase [Pseudomonas sp. URIL14HWK12:I10]PVZ37663.1 putative TIM-barrel fold metal-dependent hydrolase [Pseudomonas sp. URIL14HWK12:I11]SNZ15435.1 Predicted metal-dependent hydrolase, TIM-barrel fold [Pseudomonas sp. URIL14HWK12:I9]